MTYRSIDDSEVAIDHPITNKLVTALRDNVIAIQEGTHSITKHGRSYGVPISSFQNLNNPNAGNYVIFEETGHAVSDDSSVTSCYFRRGGTFRIQVSVRNGTTEQRNDNLPPLSQATISVRRTQHHNSDNEIVEDTRDVIARTSAKYELDLTMVADETIFVHVDEGTPSRIQVSVTMRVGVDDADAMFNADVRGNLT